MFLTKEELKTGITVKSIDLITNSSDTTVNDLIQENIDLIKNYLFKYYDVAAIFSATGDSRSRIILKHLKMLVIYDLLMIRKMDISEEQEKKYDEAMGWLEKIAMGKIEADLPRKQVDTDGDGNPDSSSTFMKLGSRKNYKNHF
ncbi:phage protein Gp36 family protein [Zunongwangia profunda]|uniref:phage protein Gp36 family protein n=1 Tax=Zunongwangia profunda TaxID=398743 RepID=UPI00248DA378|nr:phage protein Gp36 family protein [Zunongwangia profunda]|tara:strand:- start:15310 stop:15741 length:432 start_codon:yes stop_codon:yes gene_type:complete